MSTIKNQIKVIPLSAIDTDGYQRALKEGHVVSITKGFEVAQWTLPKVVQREDGTFRVVLGQHRVEVARRLAATPTSWPFDTAIGEIECQVVSGLKDVEAEARLFLNDDVNTKGLSTFDRHTAGLVAKDPRALAVQAAVDAVGITLVHKQGHQNGKTLSAIGALNNIWGMGGPSLLEEALACVSAWPDTDFKRTEGYLIGGLAQVIDRRMSAGTYIRKRVLTKLARAAHQPTAIWGVAMKTAAKTGLAFNSYAPYAAVFEDII